MEIYSLIYIWECIRIQSFEDLYCDLRPGIYIAHSFKASLILLLAISFICWVLSRNWNILSLFVHWFLLPHNSNGTKPSLSDEFSFFGFVPTSWNRRTDHSQGFRWLELSDSDQYVSKFVFWGVYLHLLFRILDIIFNEIFGKNISEVYQYKFYVQFKKKLILKPVN